MGRKRKVIEISGTTSYSVPCLEELCIQNKGDAPNVPIFRLIPKRLVRKVIQNDCEELARSFHTGGFNKVLGRILCSVEREITEEDKSGWTDEQKSVNEQFENELKSAEGWEFLSNKMFALWDGNHRVDTINRLYEVEKDPKWLVRMPASFIQDSVPSKDQFSLVATLKAVNRAASTVVKPSLPHTLTAIRQCCSVPEESMQTLMERLEPKDRHDLEKWRRKGSKIADWRQSREDVMANGSAPPQRWPPFPPLLMAKLLFSAEIEDDVSKINARNSGRSPDPAGIRSVEGKHYKKMVKYLNIVDPSHGNSWFDTVTGLSGSMAWVDLEKLHAIASICLPEDIKLRYLRKLIRMGTKEGQKEVENEGLVGIQDKIWLKWLHVDTYWVHVGRVAKRILVEDLQINDEAIIREWDIWYASQRSIHKLNMYVEMFKVKDWGSHVHETFMFELDQSARRMITRWYLSTGRAFPLQLLRWKNQNDEDTMWSILTLSISAYERNRCPFWLDYEVGKCPDFEKAEFEIHKTDPKYTLWNEFQIQGATHFLSKKRTTKIPTVPGGPHEPMQTRSLTEVPIRPAETFQTSTPSLPPQVFQTGTPTPCAESRPFHAATPGESVHTGITSLHAGTPALEVTIDDDLRRYCPEVSNTRGKHLVVTGDLKAVVQEFLNGRQERTPLAQQLKAFMDFCRHPESTLGLYVDLMIVDLPNTLVCRHPSMKYDKQLLYEAIRFGKSVINTSGYLAVFCLFETIPEVFHLAISCGFVVADTAFVQYPHGWGCYKEGRQELQIMLMVLTAPEQNRANPLALSATVLSEVRDPSMENWSWLQPKSEKLMQFVIQKLSRKGGLVADFACGTGSTLTAATKMGRNAVGMDITESFVLFVNNRLASVSDADYSEVAESRCGTNQAFGDSGCGTNQAFLE